MTSDQYVARFWRYMTRDKEECDTLDEAVAFLANGWERGKLSEIDIVGPDGKGVRAKAWARARSRSVAGGSNSTPR